MSKKTLVIGASENPERYSHLAVQRLRLKGHEVVAIGRRNGTISDVAIQKGKPDIENLDTISIYMNDKNQKEFENYILSLKPKRIIFNPGAENMELAQKALEQGIQPMEACTLVLLSTGQY